MAIGLYGFIAEDINLGRLGSIIWTTSVLLLRPAGQRGGNDCTEVAPRYLQNSAGRHLGSIWLRRQDVLDRSCPGYERETDAQRAEPLITHHSRPSLPGRRAASRHRDGAQGAWNAWAGPCSTRVSLLPNYAMLRDRAHPTGASRIAVFTAFRCCGGVTSSRASTSVL
jgi:hypothetical protein